jgi:hypothetical protein
MNFIPLFPFHSCSWDSGLVIRGVHPITVAGPRRICTGLPWHLRATGNYNETTKTVKHDYQRVYARGLRSHRMIQKTSGIVTREAMVLSTTIEAARAGSWPYFSVSTKFTTAEGRDP